MLKAMPVEIIDAKLVVRRQQLRELVPLADTTIYEMEQRGGSADSVLSGWLPRCKHRVMFWRVGRVQSCLRPFCAVDFDCWP